MGKYVKRKAMNTLPDKTMAKELYVLLDRLCIDLGFCLPPRNIERIVAGTEYDADEFTDIVFRAEGMNPEENIALQRQVRKMFTDRFGELVNNESFELD